MLARHRRGDWGDVSAQVRRVNERGLVEQFNLHSSYSLPDGRRLVVVTSRDRATTMIHLDAQ
ncbi:MAG: type I restriction endonuclease subunit M [Planctomycetota bacterium]|nr:MAG: type I restriction endonuclease subunit M [Planctomycetota bacterium]